MWCFIVVHKGVQTFESLFTNKRPDHFNESKLELKLKAHYNKF